MNIGGILYPPDIIAQEEYKPILFLAGPIQGAPSWHEKVLSHCGGYDNIQIVCPKNLGEWHGKYDEQVEWKTHYLHHAGVLGGCILFWLAKEEEYTCERAYAQTTRFELGECFSRLCYHPFVDVNLVVGIEPGFSNERYIRKRFRDRFGDTFVIYDHLLDTCEAALETVLRA